MTAYESEETAREFLARLPPVAADAVRADRTRQRCRALLARERRGRKRLRTEVARAATVLRPVAVGVFCVFCLVYVGALLVTAVLLESPSG